MLNKAEASDALAKPNFKIKQLKKASYDLCEIIHNQIFNLYTAVVYKDGSDKPQFPAFAIINKNTFNLEYIQWLKSHACFAAYLAAKENLSETTDLNLYLSMAEQHGNKHIRVVEFYHNKYKEVAQAPDLRKFYSEAKKEISCQFNFNSGKARFLDLLIMILVLQTARNQNGTHQNKVFNEFLAKIDPATTIFKTKLNNEDTLTEINELFATGAMHPILCLDDIYTHIQTLKSPHASEENSTSINQRLYK